MRRFIIVIIWITNIAGHGEYCCAKAFTHTGWLDDFEENSMDDFLISGDILVAYKGNLPEVVIPDGVRVIAEEAFRNHTELKKVHLPASVTDIGNDAFPEGIEIINE